MLSLTAWEKFIYNSTIMKKLTNTLYKVANAIGENGFPLLCLLVFTWFKEKLIRL